MFLCFSLLTVSPGMAVAAVASAAANGDSGEISGLAPPLIPRGYPAVEKHTSDKVHGTIMALTVAVIFPFGALSWHLFAGVLSTRTILYIHGLCQALGLGMLISGFGVAVWVAITHAEVSSFPLYR